MWCNLYLQDVEANTVRLKEHDQDVLVLEKVLCRASNQGNSQPQQKVGLPPTLQLPDYD